MKAREYIEHCYLPWILFLDKSDTIAHFEKNKEAYLCELYNHISYQFKTIDHYELYMFRVEFQKRLLPMGMTNVIIVKTPTPMNQGNAGMIVILYAEDQLLYYTVDFVIGTTYQIVKYKGKEHSVIATVELDREAVLNEITRDIMQF